jgi:hypothetical protein
MSGCRKQRKRIWRIFTNLTAEYWGSGLAYSPHALFLCRNFRVFRIALPIYVLFLSNWTSRTSRNGTFDTFTCRDPTPLIRARESPLFYSGSGGVSPRMEIAL